MGPRIVRQDFPMSRLMTTARTSAMTQDAAGTFSRRGLLKAGAASGAAALAGPFYLRRAEAAGELNVIMWSEYMPPDFRKGFEDKTGIAINFTPIGSNEEILAALKATGGKGYDIVCPTAHRAPQWAGLGLLQPLDMSRVPIDKVNPAMAKIGEKDWNFDGKGSRWMPEIWGTEGIAWRTDKWAPADGVPSYGDIWAKENSGMGRPQSMMLTAGLYMETIGELEPGSMWAGYKAEDAMRAAWEKVTAWCIARKKMIKVFWNDAEAQKDGLIKEGVIVGQTWDGTALALKNSGEPIEYQAPKEGAMAWVDGMAIPSGAANLDGAYAFIAYAYDPEVAGKAMRTHGYNSPVLGAEKYASEKYARNFAQAYPGDALSKLNPWPPEQPWYAAIRAEYVKKFENA